MSKQIAKKSRLIPSNSRFEQLAAITVSAFIVAKVLVIGILHGLF